jgi:predicted DNA-binding transcriptional regulator AlpA
MERTISTEKATLNIGEVAIRLGISRSSAFELARRNALPVPVIRLGRRVVVSRELVERLLASGSARGLSPEDGEAA